MNKPWYKKWWGIVLIIFFPLICLPIILIQSKINKKIKLIICLVFVMLILIMSNGSNGNSIPIIQILGVILIIIVGIKIVNTSKKERELKETLDKYNSIFNNEISERQKLNEEIENLENKINTLKEEINTKNSENEKSKVLKINLAESIEILETQKNYLYNKNKDIERKIDTQKKKLEKIKKYHEAIQYAIDQYFLFVPEDFNVKISETKFEIEDFEPNTILHLHNMDSKELNKAFKENYKQIDETLEKVNDRYSTKTNKMVYQLMVIALKSELQNILYNLKYSKLDKAIEQIKLITNKYFNIAKEGNQSIASTMAQFIGVLEYLFINAAKIEYNYYVKQEQIKQEQIALRQQMKEEAEERKALKLEKERIEKEELKFKQEIEKTETILKNSEDEQEIQNLKLKILELQEQLTNVIVKKDEITNLQNGKAGNIYIISNLGAFGDKVFKIGMTRRLDPQERINELGSASVPFKFDVHSFIFSENAVELEKELHNKLHNQRVNKVNLRKEFFYSTVDELEKLVNEIDNTASFNKTMLAEEFNQTVNYSINSDYEEEESEI